MHIYDKVNLLINKQHDHEATSKALTAWTESKTQHILTKLQLIKKCADAGNYSSFLVNHQKLEMEIKNLRNTLDRIHDLLLFDNTQ